MEEYVATEEFISEYLADLDKIAVSDKTARRRYREFREEQMGEFIKRGYAPILIHTAVAMYKDVEEIHEKYDYIPLFKGRSILCNISGREPEQCEWIVLKSVIFPVLFNVVSLDLDDARTTIEEFLPIILDKLAEKVEG